MHKVYAPKAGATTGPGKDQYRDCIDLAVKLAALLDKDVANYTNHNDIINSEAVRLVSNTPAITTLAIYNPLRLKQISDLKKMQTVNNALLQDNSEYNKNLKAVREEFNVEQAKLKKHYDLLILNIEETHAKGLSELIGKLATDLEISDYA